MKKTTEDNIIGLRQANAMVAIMALGFSFFPVVIENNLPKAGVYFLFSAIGMLLWFAARSCYRQHKQGEQIEPARIYTLIALFYTNIMLFSIYIGVWANPVQLAGSFMGFMVVALFMFIAPPAFNLCLTLSAMVVFVTSAVIIKDSSLWVFDLANALLACIIGLVFGWRITRYRISAMVSAGKLEEERNNYKIQSTMDELTQLKNRRDFEQAFDRFMRNHRSSDRWMCIALIDVDCFKKYNDHYGHLKGDESLQAIGKLLNDIREGMGVYAARIGGEEFALIWFEERDWSRVNDIVTWIHRGVRDLNIHHERSIAEAYLTVSIGVYVSQCGLSGDERRRFIYEQADKALYQAKESGRNCSIISGEDFEQYKITVQ
ncbi:MAG: GGDEF domain-containing protein [Oscillospiraceae bacterium]|nr:GGDEF domain-containing protein [Oscillospiraceae bacterium]